MRYSTIQRDPGAFQQPVTPDQISAMCERAFGRGTAVKSARELGGGEFNTIYLVTLAGLDRVILRVGPAPTAHVFWHEAALMAREQTIQPYFAPIAALLPRTIMVDFTRQIVDRDYMFQTFMPGELWSEIADDLAPDEDEALWRQLARIAKTIHGVRGEEFGYPYPGPRFPSWSRAVIGMLERTLADVEAERLDATDLRAVLLAAEGNRPVLDEITQPRLSHGDLWRCNVLIERGGGEPTICAVLDTDRAWWCDPMADWTVHLLGRASTARALRGRDIFWDEYGRPEQSTGAQFRATLYEGMHAGAVLAWSRRHHRDDVVAIARDKIREVAVALSRCQAL